MEITERQKFILEKIIQEYIRSALPVSSGFFENKYEIGIKPASIRLEFQRLTDMGYLDQPHISAGRVPTDRGYRFFVDQILEKRKDVFLPEAFSKKISALEKEMADSLRFFSDLTKLLADFSSGLALTFIADDKVCLKEGWAEALEEPELLDFLCSQEFSSALERLEKSMADFFEEDEEMPLRVLIGRENNRLGCGSFSLILKPASFPFEKKGVLALMGPKRMRYSRNIALMDYFTEFLEKF